MSMLQMNVLDPDEQAVRNEEILVANQKRERERLAAANRKAGHPLPRVGDKLYVQLQKGIKQRSRAGCVFTDAAPTEILVVASQDEADKSPYQATVDGAELIFGDNALTVGTRGRHGDDTVEGLLAQAAELQAQAKRLKDENAALQRKARQESKPSETGAPSRLIAAREAKAGHPGPPSDPDPEGFGGGSHTSPRGGGSQE